MNNNLSANTLRQQAEAHRQRLVQLADQMHRYGCQQMLLDDYTYHHRRVVHLHDHYGV